VAAGDDQTNEQHRPLGIDIRSSGCWDGVCMIECSSVGDWHDRPFATAPVDGDRPLALVISSVNVATDKTKCM
jgi:hypothetical protein